MSARLDLVFVLCGVMFIACVQPRSAYSQTKPTVVSTNPAAGATGVSPSIASFSITFSTIMASYCGATTANWFGAAGPGSSCTWSADGKTMTVTRDASSPLPASTVVTVSLNPPGAPPWLRDSEGNFLDFYTFSFKIMTTGSFEEIPANPLKGFFWSYYLTVPDKVKTPAFLLVEPNNTGTVSDDSAVHNLAAKNEAVAWSSRIEELGCPHLIPTFPRPASHPEIYTHALDRNTLTTKVAGLERIDLQLLAMIDDARDRLAGRGISLDRKFFMMGVSASAQFTSRFVMLHPDRIKAASIGAPGYGPIVPVAQWKGEAVPYHTGIGDLESLINQKFDVATFRDVPLQIYVGDMDTNIVPWYRPSNDAEAALIEELFGGGGAEEFWRWANYEAAYAAVQSASQFVVFPGMGHQWAGWSYMKEFFERNRATPAPPPLPKPLLYTLYFPHAACVGTWRTELAITNTGEGAPVSGELRAFGADGGQPLQTVPVTIPAAGRKEFDVCGYFTRSESVAYLSFASDSGFVAGYTRFSQPGMRASLGATTGTRQGWFLKVEQDGWTGVAFVNVEQASATVTLSAMDENGIEIGRETIPVAPGKKIVGMVNQVFSSDVTRAKYFKYSSDKQVLGFTVSGSGDGLMLDGLASMPQFSKYLERQK